MAMFNYLKRKQKRTLQHLGILMSFCVYMLGAVKINNYMYDSNGPSIDSTLVTYGYIATLILYCFKAVVFLSIPFTVFCVTGLVIFNPMIKTKRGMLSSDRTGKLPFVCFRVVTRGLYPKLVREVTEKNINKCRKVGMKNFKFEVVTDTELNLPKSHYVREVLVPKNYHTFNGTLFKARALHYCLHENVNILSADDWIIHLDEETMLTKRVIFGIVDFIKRANADIGQGVITYGGGDIENWLTTLMDGIRTSVDFGLYRFALQLLHRPIFGLKGSFIVVRMDVEEKIGFDFGPKESIAEDLRFALTAWNMGYKFDFVEGVMKEKSTFSLADFIKQRKRWFMGHFHVLWGNSLPLYLKLALLPMNVSNILMWANLLNGPLSFYMSVPVPWWYNCLLFAMSGTVMFLFAFGNFMSLCNRRYTTWQRLCLCFISQFVMLVSGFLEAYAILLGLMGRNTVSFDIVQKEKKRPIHV